MARRTRVPESVKRAAAIRLGGIPGETVEVLCAYCEEFGSIHWWRNLDGSPSAWVTFSDLTLDHIVPLAQGGSNDDPDNITLACKSCNSSKRDRVLSEWMEARR